MLSMKLITIAEKISGDDKSDFHEGATLADIVAFENENGVTLPVEVKEWLLFSDGGYFFSPEGIELYGVTEEPKICADRRKWGDEDYIEIGKFCTGGDPILCKSGSEKIYIFDPETNKIDDDDVQEGLFAFMESWREFFNEISED